ncbi:MAG TPA: OsmC family protein [Gemmatimonadaceae bacterium]|jgi:organic hydroperoxide reductase OsmC/OhrA
MSGRAHHYAVHLEWTGNTGAGTRDYRSYERAHELRVDGKPVIPASSDPAFRGDASRYNPEEMLVASLSSCHMLWYLHLASDAGLVVTAYRDDPVGVMRENADGSGEFTDVLLRPTVTVRHGSDTATVETLHHRAHDLCFIARSVRFPVRCEATLITELESQSNG